MSDGAKAVPLTELLRKVPAGARHFEEDADGYATTHHPVGRMCHEAADEIERLRAQVAALQEDAIRTQNEVVMPLRAQVAALQAERDRAVEQSLESAAAVLRAVAERDGLRALLIRAIVLVVRYRRETPLGHQPHMIADVAEQFITDAQGVK